MTSGVVEFSVWPPSGMVIVILGGAESFPYSSFISFTAFSSSDYCSLLASVDASALSVSPDNLLSN